MPRQPSVAAGQTAEAVAQTGQLFLQSLTSLLSILGLLAPESIAPDSEIYALPRHVLQVGAHTQDLLARERGEHTGQCHCTQTLASCA